jgi:hypothetical protein
LALAALNGAPDLDIDDGHDPANRRTPAADRPGMSTLRRDVTRRFLALQHETR